MQIFKIYSDDIESRIDPSPYQPKRLKAIKKVKSSKFQCIPLNEVVEFKKSLTSNNNNNYIYVGLENIESNTGRYITSDEVKDTFGSAFIFKKGDILFPKLRPYLNKVFLADFDGVCSTEFHVLIPHKCDSQYLFAFLNSSIVVDQTSCLMTGNTLPRLQTEDIKKLLVPIPDLETQTRIVEIIKFGYQQKHQKEKEARELLDSIEEHMFTELGLKMPAMKNKTTFSVNSDELQNKRIDPSYYKPFYKQMDEIMKKSKFEVIELEGLVTSLNNGVEIRKYTTQGFRYLRVTDLDNSGVNTNDVKYVDVNDIPAKVKLSKKDFLISRSGSLGLVTTVTDDLLSSILSSHIFKVGLRVNKVFPEYLALFLKTQFGQYQFKRKNNGGIIPEINQGALKSIQVVLPPIDIQINLANEITNVKIKAEKLLQEASKGLWEAKKQVEETLLK